MCTTSMGVSIDGTSIISPTISTKTLPNEVMGNTHSQFINRTDNNSQTSNSPTAPSYHLSSIPPDPGTSREETIRINLGTPVQHFHYTYPQEIKESTGSYQYSSERVIGRNKVCCFGYCFTGPDHCMTITAFLMILIPCCLFNATIVPWFTQTQPRLAVICIIIGTVILQFGTFALFLWTTFSDPGIIPRGRDPHNAYDVNTEMFRSSGPPKHQDVTIRGHIFRLKYCNTCNIYRTPRTVHCSVCDNCVEKFDHHCPWIGNCVGRRNYRRFYGFISFASLLAIFVMAVSVFKVCIVISDYSMKGVSAEEVFTSKWIQFWDGMVLSFFTFAIVWFVAGLWVYHSYLTYTNQTTYEQIKNYYEGELNPWDRGCRGNINEILCTRPRPRLFNTRDLYSRRRLFEPRYPEFNPQIVYSDKKSLTLLKTDRRSHSFPEEKEDINIYNFNDSHQIESTVPFHAVVCGVELCSVPNIPQKKTSELFHKLSFELEKPSRLTPSRADTEKEIPNSIELTVPLELNPVVDNKQLTTLPEDSQTQSTVSITYENELTKNKEAIMNTSHTEL